MLAEADLPDDVDALRALVLEQARELDTMKAFQAEVERLRAIIEALQRHRFGRRSEHLDPDQFELCLEEVEAALAAAERAKENAGRTPPDRPRKTNRGSLPAHLERIEQVVDVKDKSCSCCGGALHAIGEDVSERFDVVPTTFRVLVTRRPRYGCRSCEGAIVQAPAPARTGFQARTAARRHRQTAEGRAEDRLQISGYHDRPEHHRTGGSDRLLIPLSRP